MTADKKQISICDVAKRAGVSPSTVSRILNNHMGNLRVAPLTRERVLTAAHDLDYVPNINSRRLVTRRSGVIGILVPSFGKMKAYALDDRHLTRMLSGMESVFEESQYSLMLLFSANQLVHGKDPLTLFRQRSIDGLAIWGARCNEAGWEDVIVSRKPHIFVSNMPQSENQVNFIGSDYESAGYLAARHLLNKGHRRFLWLGGEPDISLYRQHSAGIHRALEEFGVPPTDLWESSKDYSMALAQEALETFLPDPPFTAVLTGNIWQADAVIRTLQNAGKTVPKDIAVVACDSTSDDDMLFPAVSRVWLDDLHIGRQAAYAILRLIDDPLMPVCEKYPVFFKSETTS